MYFLDQCKSESNPFGLVVEPGDEGKMMDVWKDSKVVGRVNAVQYYLNQPDHLDAAGHAQLVLDIKHGADMRAMGFACPSDPQQIAAMRNASPFTNPSTASVTVNNTPLIGGWQGGAIAPGTAYGPEGQIAAPVEKSVLLPMKLTPGSQDTGGFSLSDIPWWGWGIAAGAAYFAFGGSKGGR